MAQALYLILLDKRKLIPLEEGCTSVYGVGAACIQLSGLPLVDGSVARFLKLRRQEIVKVVTLNLLLSHNKSSVTLTIADLRQHFMQQGCCSKLRMPMQQTLDSIEMAKLGLQS